MNYGLYLSASGVLTNMHRQDVIANNLANASTTGFKRDLVAFSQRLVESQADPGSSDLANDLLDRLGGGVFVAPSRTDFADGSLTHTNNDLDVAISGQGMFAVQQTDSQGGKQVRLTRDGRFTLTDDGRLVTTTEGLPVLDANLQPIRLDHAATTQIDETGVIRQNGSPAGQLRLVDVSDTSSLKHLGQGLYQAPPAALEAKTQANGRVLQGWLENSNVDPVREMVDMIEATRAITNNATMMRYHDELMDRAVNVLGRVA
jgi:flagellar basal-body rod protein FlgF